MQTRRETLKQSAVLAGLLAATGLFPRAALAAFNKAAFDGMSAQEKEVIKAAARSAIVAGRGINRIIEASDRGLPALPLDQAAALDAGVPLRDVQDAASHADPRTTLRYDMARANLDRHAAHAVAAYLAGMSVG